MEPGLAGPRRPKPVAGAYDVVGAEVACVPFQTDELDDANEECDAVHEERDAAERGKARTVPFRRSAGPSEPRSGAIRHGPVIQSPVWTGDAVLAIAVLARLACEHLGASEADEARASQVVRQR